MPPPNSQSAQSPVAPEAGATVDRWLSFLEELHPTEIDLGLERVLVVLRRLFPRKPRGRIITVAGTNGKGSAVATLEALLQAAGRTTGAYTSPHLETYNERIRLNGTMIEDAALVSAFEQVEAARRGVSLTYFEFGTLAAFVALAEAGVEDWLLEVGLGGRLDAVNVLDPDLAILTSIGIDHVDFLGDNREQIGFEKAGILRPGIPAVCADTDTPRSVLQQVAAQKVKLALVGRDYQLLEDGADGQRSVLLDYQDRRVRLPSGPLPVPSVAAAVVALSSLAPDLEVARIEQVLDELTVPGRFERMSTRPDVVVDVGHNPHAATWLAQRIHAEKAPGRRVLAVYAALSDKDVVGVYEAMKSEVDEWWLAGLDVPRGLSAVALSDRLSGAMLGGCSCSDTVGQAISAARAAARPGDLIVIFGSFFTVSEARRRLSPISARKRLTSFLDGSDREEFSFPSPSDPHDQLPAADYHHQLAEARSRTGESEALVVMAGRTCGVPLVACAFDSGFLGGTMGEEVGDRFVRAVDLAIERRLPLVCFSASAGLRVQEGIRALLQMAKTAAALERMHKAGIPYISVLTEQVAGEVSASLAMLGDLNIAEPDLQMGYASTEVIEQVELDALPAGFQGSQFLLEQGAVDMILDREQMRERIAHILAKFAGQGVPDTP